MQTFGVIHAYDLRTGRGGGSNIVFLQKWNILGSESASLFVHIM